MRGLTSTVLFILFYIIRLQTQSNTVKPGENISPLNQSALLELDLYAAKDPGR